jgi:hypothetical protein
MLRRARKVAVAVGVIALLGVAAAPAGAGRSAASSRFHMYSVLEGENEVPDPGDPDGFGLGFIQLKTPSSTVCWGIGVRRIMLPGTGAHIHEGDEGVPGPIVVTLSPPTDKDHSRGCTEADPALIAAIAADPSHYYVNVHNAEFPGGAIRGQLHRFSP